MSITSTGTVIGGILGACFIIIVLAVLIVRKVRLKRMLTESNNRDYEEVSRVSFSKTTYEDLINTNHNILTAIPTQTCDIDDTSAPVYEEVNDPRKQQKIKSK
ncbi:Hypothetical predicted protein [Mytilus galloprovincialis]|uniref:Uncharacterized protein n=1 Tax=Mytilus galloprovincialis TaxID=29158 RepID=A0A8B6GT12_MYTGA|nr:Hypothetical predicted protein [Mytilus galloprovincialis]